MNILITGVAGFIGFSLAHDLLNNNKKAKIFGIDNFDDYYSKKIKDLRLKRLKKFKNFKFYKIDIRNRKSVFNFFKNKKFIYIINLAAQAGVRFSQEQPKKYLDVNIFGFINIIDASLTNPPKLFVYASSSSVYGDAKKLPVNENFKLNPINVYAATKRINEIIAKFYTNFYKLNFVGLRYFTVYGEWGRPDMFLFKLFKSFHLKKYFYLNNSGDHRRDFTYIKDAINITKRIIFKKNSLQTDHKIFNICSNKPIKIKSIKDFFSKNIGVIKVKKINRNKLDVKDTHGNNSKVKKYTSFYKFTNFRDGILNSYNWYKDNKIYRM
jgi:UDP-glucuronate 4-epimerase